jgi:hypothetical protein
MCDKNREKARLLTLYSRNAAVIEEAFKVMMEGSGIDQIDEVVSAFIKSEEQSYQIWNYVHNLGQECDTLDS